MDTTTEDVDDDDNAVEGATSSTYTPTSDDSGNFLAARVIYTDRHGANQMATSSVTTGVRTNADNQAPKFGEGASTFRVVMEDAEANAEADVTTDNLGLPIRATDVNSDALTYTLGGPDAANFQVRVTVDANNAGPGHAQLEVSAAAALDHETKPRLTVTLTANDNSGASNSTAHDHGDDLRHGRGRGADDKRQSRYYGKRRADV